MIDHLSTYATDYPVTRAFYLSVFDSLGVSLQIEFVTDWDRDFPTRRCCAFGRDNQTTFWIIEEKETASPRHIAFSASSRKMVDSFYEKSLGAGGKCNGAPGLRPHYHENYYGAFILDPDGNDIEAVCHRNEEGTDATQ